VTPIPLLEVGQSVLVAPAPDEAPWRMVVDLVQEGHVTLATPDDEVLPREWRDLDKVHITALDRYSVHLIHVPVVRVGETRVVVGEPGRGTPVQRRAYARVLSPVPTSCMLLDPDDNDWIPFEADVRDLGGGGCSFVADVPVPEGATVVVSFALDDQGPIVAVARVLPREALPTIGRPLTRVEFVLVREVERDRILRYVLQTLARRRHHGTAHGG
jgi:hypothetical protein